MSDRPRPSKPYPDFPLFPHAIGRCVKKIRGKLHEFGKWNDPGGAFQKYVEQRGDLQAGRTRRTQNGGILVREACNPWLESKRRLIDTRDWSRRTGEDYHRVCLTLRDVLGRNEVVSDLHPHDSKKLGAAVAKISGPVTLGKVPNTTEAACQQRRNAVPSIALVSLPISERASPSSRRRIGSKPCRTRW